MRAGDIRVSPSEMMPTFNCRVLHFAGAWKCGRKKVYTFWEVVDEIVWKEQKGKGLGTVFKRAYFCILVTQNGRM
jgi:hypothetical protein